MDTTHFVSYLVSSVSYQTNTISEEITLKHWFRRVSCPAEIDKLVALR